MNENNIIGRILPLGNYSFFLEIYIAMFIILVHSKKRRLFPVRALLGFLIGIPFYFLPMITLWKFNYSYTIIVLSCLVIGLFLYKEKTFVSFFAAIAAWGLQHIAWNLLGILYDLIPDVDMLSNALLITILVLVFAFVYFIAFFIFFHFKIVIQYKKNQLFSFLIAFFMILTTMFLSQSVKTWDITIRLYTTISALLSLLIMIGYPYFSNLIIKEKELSDEKNNLEKMLELQASQQQLSKQATDILNLKFHDMKNQLLLMKNVNETERKKISDELEKSIDVYTDIARTGNEAMDIVVTQKALLCSNEHIRFTYILSGECLSFMNKSDITSLFGNILDNAIEAAKEEKGDFRLIKLKTYSQNGLVLIQEENYCHRKVSFHQNGLPISNKKDNINHGYGTKSILYIVEKYQGQISIRQEDNIYFLNIAIPVSVDARLQNMSEKQAKRVK